MTHSSRTPSRGAAWLPLLGHPCNIQQDGKRRGPRPAILPAEPASGDTAARVHNQSCTKMFVAAFFDTGKQNAKVQEPKNGEGNHAFSRIYAAVKINELEKY